MPAESNSTSSVYALAALGRLLDEHRPKLLAMLQRRIDPALNARIDPESILNDVFFVARRRWADFQAGTMTPYAWLYRLALDQLIEAWHKNTRGRRDVQTAGGPEPRAARTGAGAARRIPHPPPDCPRRHGRNLPRGTRAAEPQGGREG